MTLPKLTDFVFFGTNEFAVTVLTQLLTLDYRPTLIITTVDKPRGRGLRLASSPVAVWAKINGVPYDQLENLNSLTDWLKMKNWNFFLVADYGKIIPSSLFMIPRHGMINIHPSLLPKYRGPTPIQSAIIANDTESGVSLMLVDEQVDHGPILVKE